jgi:tripartite ATP-independent transporter DctP family solute receptor
MNHFGRRDCLRLGAAAAAGLCLGPAAAQARFTIRYNHVLGPAEPYHEGFLSWARRVEERTRGALRIEVFHSAQLGREEDIIEQLRQGAPLGQNTDAARLGNFVPSIAVLNAPYFMENVDDVARLRESPTVRQWTDELAQRHGLRVLSFGWVQGHRHFFTNRAVRRPEDLRGLRIRTPPAPVWQESIRALGASPVAMAFGEMYPALQQRAIDGVELVYNNIPAGRFWEVLRYANETRHITLVNFQVVSARFFDSLPREFQQALVEEADRAGLETSRRIQQLEAEVRPLVRARGMTIVEDVDLPAFRRAGERAYEVLNLTEQRRAVFRDMGRS